MLRPPPASLSTALLPGKAEASPTGKIKIHIRAEAGVSQIPLNDPPGPQGKSTSPAKARRQPAITSS